MGFQGSRAAIPLPSMSQGNQDSPRLVPAPQTSSSSSAHFPSLLLQAFPSSLPGLEIPVRMGRMGSLHGTGTHSQPVYEARGFIPPQGLLPWLSQNLSPQPGLGWCRGTRQLLCHTHTQGLPRADPALAPHKTRGGLRGEGVSSHPATTSCTHGAAKNSPPQWGPCLALVALNRLLLQGLSQHRNSVASGGKYSS